MASLLDLDIDNACKLTRVLSFTSSVSLKSETPAPGNSPESAFSESSKTTAAASEDSPEGATAMDVRDQNYMLSGWPTHAGTMSNHLVRRNTMDQRVEDARQQENYMQTIAAQTCESNAPHNPPHVYPVDQFRNLSMLQSYIPPHISANYPHPGEYAPLANQLSSPYAVATSSAMVDMPFCIPWHKINTCFAYALDRGNGQYTQLIPADCLPAIESLARVQGPEGLIVLPTPRAAAPLGHPKMDGDVSHTFLSDQVLRQVKAKLG
jgi:hypothetical protein